MPIFRFFFALLLAFSASAFADTVPGTSSTTTGYAVNGWQSGQTTKTAAAAGWCSPTRNIAWTGNYGLSSAQDNVKCERTNGQWDYWYPITTYSLSVLSCPANSTSNGTSCTCSSGYVADAGQCVVANPCLSMAGQAAGNGYTVEFTGAQATKSALVSMIGTTASTNLYKSGSSGALCEATGKISSCGLFTGAAGSTLVCTIDNVTFSGNNQNTSGTTAPTSAVKQDSSLADAIAKGQCPGTVNGLTVYVPCGASGTPEKSTTTGTATGTNSTGSTVTSTNADGTVTKTATTTKTNADGSTSTTATTCTGDSCTTITTIKDAAGAVTGTSSAQGAKATICSENPSLSLCKTSTFNAAPCDAVPACDGDAVQCAIARKQHEESCKFTKGAEALKALLDAAIAADASSNPALNVNSQTFALSSLINQDGNGLSGGCPADVTVVVAGRSVVIPWSQTCSTLQMLGSLAVAVSMLAAAMIVFRT